MCPACEALLENPSLRGAHLPLAGIRTLQLRNLWGEATCPECGAQWDKSPMQPWVLKKAPNAKPAPAKRLRRK
jgi:hypothetical protein